MLIRKEVQVDGIWWQNGFLLLGLIIWVLTLLYVSKPEPRDRR